MSQDQILSGAPSSLCACQTICIVMQQGEQQGPKAEISNLAWNPKTAYILATCTTAGDVTICNLKKMAAVLSLTDEQG